MAAVDELQLGAWVSFEVLVVPQKGERLLQVTLLLLIGFDLVDELFIHVELVDERSDYYIFKYFCSFVLVRVASRILVLHFFDLLDYVWWRVQQVLVEDGTQVLHTFLFFEFVFCRDILLHLALLVDMLEQQLLLFQRALALHKHFVLHLLNSLIFSFDALMVWSRTLALSLCDSWWTL